VSCSNEAVATVVSWAAGYQYAFAFVQWLKLEDCSYQHMTSHS
jgi:hypothetical protein